MLDSLIKLLRTVNEENTLSINITIENKTPIEETMAIEPGDVVKALKVYSEGNSIFTGEGIFLVTSAAPYKNCYGGFWTTYDLKNKSIPDNLRYRFSKDNCYLKRKSLIKISFYNTLAIEDIKEKACSLNKSEYQRIIKRRVIYKAKKYHSIPSIDDIEPADIILHEEKLYIAIEVENNICKALPITTDLNEKESERIFSINNKYYYIDIDNIKEISTDNSLVVIDIVANKVYDQIKELKLSRTK